MSYKILSGKGVEIANKRLAEKRKANKAIPDTKPYHRQATRTWARHLKTA